MAPINTSKKIAYHSDCGITLKTPASLELERTRLVAVIQIRERTVDHARRELKRIEAAIVEAGK